MKEHVSTPNFQLPTPKKRFVIPRGCIGYLPGLAILGRADPLGTSLPLQWMAPLAGPLFLLICLQAWRFGVRHYQSTGSCTSHRTVTLDPLILTP
jgi:hypothetical protein